MRSSPSKSPMPNRSSFSPIPQSPGTSKSASMDVCVPVDLTWSAVNLSPRIMFIASTIRDFPRARLPGNYVQVAPEINGNIVYYGEIFKPELNKHMFFQHPVASSQERGAPRKFPRAAPGFSFLPDRYPLPRTSKSSVPQAPWDRTRAVSKCLCRFRRRGPARSRH